jgi:hypothetical protein
VSKILLHPTLGFTRSHGILSSSTALLNPL